MHPHNSTFIFNPLVIMTGLFLMLIGVKMAFDYAL